MLKTVNCSRTGVQFAVPTLGGSPRPIRLVLGNSASFFSILEYLHSCAHSFRRHTHRAGICCTLWSPASVFLTPPTPDNHRSPWRLYRRSYCRFFCCMDSRHSFFYVWPISPSTMSSKFPQFVRNSRISFFSSQDCFESETGETQSWLQTDRINRPYFYFMIFFLEMVSHGSLA